MKHAAYVLTVAVGVFLSISCSAESSTPEVSSFQECATAGYPLLKTYPPQCKAPDGTVYTGEKAVSANGKPLRTEYPAAKKKFCVDKCGNGKCEEIVCQAQGCPCAETKDSCPADCS